MFRIRLLGPQMLDELVEGQEWRMPAAPAVPGPAAANDSSDDEDGSGMMLFPPTPTSTQPNSPRPAESAVESGAASGSVSTLPAKVWVADHGVPVFWQEKKPVEFWEDIIEKVDRKMVVDLSPGSGSVGRACMRNGVQYVAACFSELHRQWVSNALDREACELITIESSPFHETDLATLIQTHFSNILEQAEMMRREDESDDDDDDDDGEDATEAPPPAPPPA